MAKNTGLLAGTSGADPLSELPDGVYKMEIIKSNLRDAADKLVCDLELEVLWGPEGAPVGEKIKNATWVKDKDSAKRFMKLLDGLGFDTDAWKRDESQEKMAPIAVRYMTGMRVEANKKESPNKDGGKPYQNLYINKRAGGDDFADGKPEKISDEDLLAWAEDNPDLSSDENINF